MFNKLKGDTQSFVRLINLSKTIRNDTTYKYDKDLDALINMASSNPVWRRLLPLFYKNLVDGLIDAPLKPDTVKFLKQTNLKSALSFSQKQLFIRQLIAGLEAANTTIYLLKSMAFTGDMYSPEFTRFGADIDMLTQSNDKQKLSNELSKHAQILVPDVLYPFEGAYEACWRSSDIHRILIDQHFYLTNPKLYTIDEQQIVKNSSVHPFYNSSAVRILSSEMVLIHLALHMSNDCNYWHYNLLDIHELVNVKQPDIVKAFEICKKYQLGYALFYALEICMRFLDTPIDKNILVKQKPNKIRYLCGQFVIHNVLTRPALKKSLLHRFQQILVQVVVMKNTKKMFLLALEYLQLRIITRLKG
jgi:hypothetical protein